MNVLLPSLKSSQFVVYINTLFENLDRIANILTALNVPVSDSACRQNPPVKLASLSTVSSAKRGTAGLMNSRHMRGAMIISIRSVSKK